MLLLVSCFKDQRTSRKTQPALQGARDRQSHHHCATRLWNAGAMLYSDCAATTQGQTMTQARTSDLQVPDVALCLQSDHL